MAKLITVEAFGDLVQHIPGQLVENKLINYYDVEGEPVGTDTPSTSQSQTRQARENETKMRAFKVAQPQTVSAVSNQMAFSFDERGHSSWVGFIKRPENKSNAEEVSL
jgi:hypothetical protein